MVSPKVLKPTNEKRCCKTLIILLRIFSWSQMELRMAVACLSYKSTAATQSFLRVSSENKHKGLQWERMYKTKRGADICFLVQCLCENTITNSLYTTVIYKIVKYKNKSIPFKISRASFEVLYSRIGGLIKPSTQSSLYAWFIFS